jgi:ribonuclease HII
MILPTKSIERALIRRGIQWIAAVDEAGRGSWAGPVVAGALLFDARFFHSRLRSGGARPTEQPFGQARASRLVISNRSSKYYKGLAFLRDSKLLTHRQREAYYHALTRYSEVKEGIGVVDCNVIDEMNIHCATLLAMRQAIESLPRVPDIVLVDGLFSIPGISYPQEYFTHGDRRIFSIAAASIIAKVTRDRMMEKYAEKYPEYGFEKHKGYGTKFHQTRLVSFGPSPIHRMSYTPVASLVKV